MGYADIIAREVDLLIFSESAQAIDCASFVNGAQGRKKSTSLPKQQKEIKAFFRSFNVDSSGYIFDREDANVR